jgi:hypothetical protein
MEKSSQIAWKFVPLRHFFPLKVVLLIEVLLYDDIFTFRRTSLAASQHDRSDQVGTEKSWFSSPIPEGGVPHEEVRGSILLATEKSYGGTWPR